MRHNRVRSPSPRPVSTLTTQKNTQVDSYVIIGSANGCATEILLDSGSAISPISASFFDQFSEIDYCLSVCSSDSVALSVTEDSVDILGQVELVVQLYGMTRADAYKEIKKVFKVARSIMYDCLLGIDFMKAHYTILDIDKEVITLKSDDAITMHKLIEMFDSEGTYNVFA